MPVPDHIDCAAAAMAAELHDRVRPAFTGTVHVVDDREPVLEEERKGVTAVPFFKVALQGRFVLPAVGARPRLVVRPGDALLFVAGSYANDTFPEPSRFFRATIADGQSLIGIETVRRQGGRRYCRIEGHYSFHGLDGCGQAVLDALPVAAEEERANLVRVLLDRLLRLLRRPEAQVGAGAQQHAAVLHFLREHYAEAITRTVVARSLGMSEGQVSRLCGRYGERGFNEELTALRLTHARRLLADRQLPVAAVAAASGFSSGNYFAQAFRAAHGCSPSAWRAQNWSSTA